MTLKSQNQMKMKFLLKLLPPQSIPLIDSELEEVMESQKLHLLVDFKVMERLLMLEKKKTKLLLEKKFHLLHTVALGPNIQLQMWKKSGRLILTFHCNLQLQVLLIH